MASVNRQDNDIMQAFEAICRQFGLSITPQRTAIYKELTGSAEHPSAITIFNKIREYYPNISLDTVNRTLLTFHEIGLAKVVEGSGDAKRFDPNLTAHHHFRCIRCGKIIDFSDHGYDAIEIPRELQDKFIVTAKIVHLEGICDGCRSTVPHT